MIFVVDMLGRIAAQPRNGALLKISICPDKMATFSSSGGCLAKGFRLSCFQALSFMWVGVLGRGGSYVLGPFGLQRNLCGDRTAEELHQLSKSPDIGITVYQISCCCRRGRFFPHIIFVIFCLFCLFSSSLIRHPDD